jgi:hypothetical protein
LLAEGDLRPFWGRLIFIQSGDAGKVRPACWLCNGATKLLGRGRAVIGQVERMDQSNAGVVEHLMNLSYIIFHVNSAFLPSCWTTVKEKYLALYMIVMRL